MTLLQSGLAKSLAEDYTIDQSLRFNEPDEAYLSWTPSTTATSSKIFTVSCWVKRGEVDAERRIFTATQAGATPRTDFGFLATSALTIGINPTGSTWYGATVSPFYRDPSAWYHIVWSMDTSQVTPADRSTLYVNGVEVTDFLSNNLSAGTPIPQDSTVLLGQSGMLQTVGAYGNYIADSTFDGYIAEFYFVDGVEYAPAIFAETSETTNQWIPLDSDDVKDAVTFGNNGFYQKYASTELADSFEGSSGNAPVIDAFTSTGSDTWTCPTGVTSVELLVVAGGGGGGGKYYAGGGGAGGVVHDTAYTVVPGVVYDLTVGTKGDGGSWYTTGDSGANSTFNDNAEGSGSKLTAIGGGGGGTGSDDAGDGGSGGGRQLDATYDPGSTTQQTAGTASGGTITSYGYDGGGNAAETSASGGGGASAVGDGSGAAAGGDGGAGQLFSTFVAYGTDSSNVASTGANGGYFAGGGGGAQGGGGAASASSGGVGGGGVGGIRYPSAAGGGSGLANTGGGGGGASHDTGGSGDGGSGVILIKYLGDHTITANGDVANTRAQSKVGDSSIVFDGTGDYLSVDNTSNLKLGSTSDSWTIEFWVRITSQSGSYIIMDHRASTQADGGFSFFTDVSSGGVGFDRSNGSAWTAGLQDSANTLDQWYHYAVVQVGDTSLKMYRDGTEVDTTATLMDDDSGTYVNWFIGGGYNNGGSHSDNYYFDGYLDEIRVSDVARYTGAFTPSTTEFTTDANTLLLIHSNWDGGLGADSSGNENDFAPTNLVATDVVLDSPTNNFATLNPLDNYYAGNTFSEGNLEIAQGTSGPYTYNSSTISMSSGKWYSEFLMVDDDRGSGYILTGISSVYPDATTDELGDNANAWAYYGYNGNYWNNNSGTSYGNSYAEGDVIGIALDLENNNLYFSKNGVWQDSGDPESGATGTGAISITAGEYRFCIGSFDNAYSFIFGANFGADSSFAGNLTAQGNQDGRSIGDFYYEPPSGFFALCTDNLPAPEIALPTEHFNTRLYTGDGATTLAVTGVGFAPDFTWIKNRDEADDHTLVDAVRGATKYLVSNEADAEVDDSTFVASLDSDGFTVGDDVVVNTNTENYLSWNWKGDGVAGGTTNEDGTIDSQVNVNTTAGFSIVKWTGTGSNVTVGHGLSQAPDLIINKSMSDAEWWAVQSILWNSPSDTNMVYLNSNGAASDDTNVFQAAPTATVFSPQGGAWGGIGANESDYIAYCFHSVEGYSKIGSYDGNSNGDGPFIYCGFKPCFVFFRGTFGTSWYPFDDGRDPYNRVQHWMEFNEATADYDDTRAAGSSALALDFVSNGFKLRGNNSGGNGSYTYLYMAVASSPFKYSNAR